MRSYNRVGFVQVGFVCFVGNIRPNTINESLPVFLVPKGAKIIFVSVYKPREKLLVEIAVLAVCEGPCERESAVAVRLYAPGHQRQDICGFFRNLCLCLIRILQIIIPIFIFCYRSLIWIFYKPKIAKRLA